MPRWRRQRHLSNKFPQTYDRRVLPQVDSTNAEAGRIIGSITRPTWILGLRQTQGRGRRGRPWSDPDGNFAATLVLIPDQPAHQLALRSFVASLALYDALMLLTRRSDVFTLKWPNDVLLNGSKLAGILLETLPRNGQSPGLAIGIGVNLLNTPATDRLEPQALRPVSVLSELGMTLSPQDFLDALATSYAYFETQFVTHGFSAIRDAWLARAARLGEQITAKTVKQTITGRFDTIDLDGQLVLHNAQGRHVIAAADVFFKDDTDAVGN